ncbi:MAG: DUF4465 domain-containing protein [Opitutales bacterium]|nr:DUF4465 domain-containing protein [Opitutales bacterium]
MTILGKRLGARRIGALLSGWAVVSGAVSVHGATTIDFGDLSLGAESFFIGADGSGGFNSGGAHFPTNYNADWGSWGGFAYSNRSSNVVAPGDITAGLFWAYQYQTAPGGAFAGDIFGIHYADGSTLQLPAGLDQPLSIHLTNSLYTWASMTYGDAFSRQFSAANGDFFTVQVFGYDDQGFAIGSVEFALADFRSADPTEHFIVDEWIAVDLTALGSGVREIGFQFASADVGGFGINTPLYVAFDQLVVIPEPRTTTLLSGLLVLCVATLRKRLREPRA